MGINGFLDKNPFVRIVIPYALGIIAQYYTHAIDIVCVILMCLLLATAVFLYRKHLSMRLGWLPGLALFATIGAMGFTTAQLADKPSVPHEAGRHKCLYRASVTNHPADGGKALKADLKIEAVNILDAWREFDAKIVATIMKDSAATCLKAGQTIEFSSRIDSLDMPKNPFGFDYSQYLQLNGVQGSIFLNPGEWKLVDGSVHGLKQRALNARQTLVGLLEKAGLEGNELGLASTLVLGYKSSIDAEVKQSYMNAGAMHVLAVSGMHVGIVCAVLELLMMALGGNLAFRLKRVLIILLLWTYAFITGLSPSVLRATVMFTFVELGRLIRREMSIYNTLAASAFLLLAINPDMLFKAGFQLSYAAVVGIVTLQPRIVRLIKINHKRRVLRYLWELTAVSVAAQIATLPFCLYYFERTPVYFWLSNIIVSPGAAVMIGLTMLLLAVSPIGVAAKWVGVATSWVAKSMNHWVTIIANLPGSTIENSYISVYQSLAVAGVIVGLLVWLKTRRCNWLMGSLAALLVYITPFSLKALQNSTAHALCVWYSPRNAMVQFVEGNRSFWLKDSIGDSRQAGLMVKGANIFWKSNRSGIVAPDNSGERVMARNGFFVFDSVCGMVVGDKTVPFKIKQADTLDFLIVSSAPGIRVRQMPRNLKFRNVIIDGTVKPWVAKEWERWFAGCRIHCVRRQGAYICRLR
ncbi:MAG: ComEC family competence protein [Salinivirgaceae bacterium]|nr:ComEC family competence protein [Salinivirgaceae bacterium]